MSKRPIKHFPQVDIIIIAILLSLFIGFFGGLLIFCSSFYVHEGGHLIYGWFDSKYHNQNVEFQITNTIKCPFLTFIKLPQRTEAFYSQPIPRSVAFAMGGSIAVMLVSAFFAYVGYIHTKKKLYWAFPVIFVINEVITNFLCGTDNYLGEPLFVYKNVNLITQSIVIFLLICLVIFLCYPKILDALRKKLVK